MYGNVFEHVVALLVALGGFEFIKWLLSARSHRRKEAAAAKQEEAVAGQGDADLRQKELDLLNGIIAVTKEQFEDLKHKYDHLVKRAKEEAYHIAQNDRRIKGLERAFHKEVAKKVNAELHYCGKEGCKEREPEMGSYHTDTIDISVEESHSKRGGRKDA